MFAVNSVNQVLYFCQAEQCALILKFAHFAGYDLYALGQKLLVDLSNCWMNCPLKTFMVPGV